MYPVTYEQDYVEHQSRLTTLFRIFTIIPHYLWLTIYSIAFMCAAVVAWFAIVFTGRFPEGLYKFCADFLRFNQRFVGYMLCIVDKYPPFDGGEHPEYPVRVQFAAPKAEYSRVKTLFRLILFVPVAIVLYVLQIWLMLLSVCLWFAIVFTGKAPQGIIQLTLLPMTYTARANAYAFLLTEDFPPISE